MQSQHIIAFLRAKKFDMSTELSFIENYAKEKQAFVLSQYRKLIDLFNELSETMHHQTEDALSNKLEGSEASGSGMHQGDAGSEAYDREFALNMLGKEVDSLKEIEQAIKRVEEGKYGVCGMSGDDIPQMRLEAIPFTRYTVACQAQWEEEQKNKPAQKRDDYGYSGFGEQSSTNSLDED